uniref:Uncharacterized protein n=1 Tax=Setaria viridis TaxID=4556 RepID=A0A4U6V0P1_SETVI|nr:hypothetical protein SEVIR_4G239400v2 [Setaria viridis]
MTCNFNGPLEGNTDDESDFEDPIISFTEDPFIYPLMPQNNRTIGQGTSDSNSKIMQELQVFITNQYRLLSNQIDDRFNALNKWFDDVIQEQRVSLFIHFHAYHHLQPFQPCRNQGEWYNLQMSCSRRRTHI